MVWNMASFDKHIARPHGHGRCHLAYLVELLETQVGKEVNREQFLFDVVLGPLLMFLLSQAYPDIMHFDVSGIL